MDLGRRGRVAVTGGSVGIGLAVAEGLAAEGARVVREAARVGEAAGVETLGVARRSSHLVALLCSDKATYSVGPTSFVDGGMLRTI